MKEMILRIQSDREDADILVKDGNSETFKKIKNSVLVNKLIRHFSSNESGESIHFIDESIVGYSLSARAINEPEAKRIVIYKDKSYNITFPNALYIVYSTKDSISKIVAFAYKKWEGKKTILFKYPMPNMLNDNKICLGTAPKKIKNRDYKSALDLIIYTQYTHSFVDDIKSFKNTVDYFEYLESNPFPYDLLIKANKKVGDFLD